MTLVRPGNAARCFLVCCHNFMVTAASTSDSSSGSTMLDESLAISSELGMRPWMERVLARREILKA